MQLAVLSPKSLYLLRDITRQTARFSIRYFLPTPLVMAKLPKGPIHR
jgi:hypothetical protein